MNKYEVVINDGMDGRDCKVNISSGSNKAESKTYGGKGGLGCRQPLSVLQANTTLPMETPYWANKWLELFKAAGGVLPPGFEEAAQKVRQERHHPDRLFPTLHTSHPEFFPLYPDRSGGNVFSLPG